MRIGIVSVYMDHLRRGKKDHGIIQPAVGLIIAGMLPASVEIDLMLETIEDLDYSREYDLLFLSCLHPDFDHARQISHYWRRRGAKVVLGGPMANTYPQICMPFFDSVIMGDAESSVPMVFKDFCEGNLQPFYAGTPYDPARVPVPRFDLLVGKVPFPLLFEATRGCPFSCEFCSLSGVGTRFHTRTIPNVIRDLQEGQRMLRERGAPWYQRRFVTFLDNNIGGNPSYLRQFAEALIPLKLGWGSAITFNALNQPGMIEVLARSGAQGLYVGLETFNPKALIDMHKFQNKLDQTRKLIDDCRAYGISLNSGLMISPTVDTWEYIQTIPQKLRESGLHVPVFISFEAPIPGTPFFERLATEEKPALLPDALLRDFTGSTLVVQPKGETAEQHIDGYRWALDHVYVWNQLLGKFWDDSFRLVRGGSLLAAAGLINYYGTNKLKNQWASDPMRSYLAGTDTPPPETLSVPFEESDFDSEEKYNAIMNPMRVTDSRGRVMPEWQQGVHVFEKGGVISAAALQLAAR
jgi:radical SAM superfamily enzyme YgiQ (UPF0313 family)